MVVGGRRADVPRILDNGSREFSRLRDYRGRGVLTTATYEARVLGLHSAMPTMQAAKLAPDAFILPADFELYKKYSKIFKNVIRSISPVVENIGIDEVYADVSELSDDSETIARRMRQSVFLATGLTCSVGVAPNKLLAKISSDMNKPDGFTIIEMEDVPSKIWPLPVSKVNGIGPKANDKLASYGIFKIGQIAEKSEIWIIERFGLNYGRWLKGISHGIDERQVTVHREPISISREVTFEKNLSKINHRDELKREFNELCKKIHHDLDVKGYKAKKIGIKIKFEDFSIVTRDKTLDDSINDFFEIRRVAGQCITRINIDKPIRLLGVKVGGW